MKECIEQSTKRMQETWSQWEQMVYELPWMDKSEASLLRWSPGISAMRTTFDTNMRTWKTFVEHSECTFFKMLEQFPFHNGMTESAFRRAWDSMKQAHESYREIVETQFQKMEGLLKKEA
jgi:hypothetical protein